MECDMTREEAERLGEVWKRMGEEPCVHVTFAIETGPSGYLPTHYFCLTCGASISILPCSSTNPCPPA